MHSSRTRPTSLGWQGALEKGGAHPCPRGPAHPLSFPVPLPLPQHDGILAGWTQREPLGHPDGARATAPARHQPCAQ